MPNTQPHDQRDARAPQSISRRRFTGAAAVWAGSLALGRQRGEAAASAVERAAAVAGTRAARFLALFEQHPPFSFSYGGRPSPELLPGWPRSIRRTALDPQRTQHTIRWSEPQSGFTVRCEVVEYHDSPTVDWTLYFSNEGARLASPLTEVLALDTTLQRTRGAEFLIHTCNGSAAVDEDYAVQATPLGPRRFILFTCNGGRPTNGYFRLDPQFSRAGSPYYNIDWGGEGAIVVVGWPGQWATEMTRDAGTGLRLQSGMTSRDGADLTAGDHIHDADLLVHALQPKEEIRTPRIVIQFWDGGDWIAAQNIWRRWMLAHNVPTVSGRPPAPMCPIQNVGGYGPNMLANSASSDLSFLQAVAAERLAWTAGGVCDHFWMDAGWYQVPPEATDWTWTGTWKPDPVRYPQGLRPVTDRAHAMGLKTIVWHEPERVRPNTYLYNEHPDWLLGPGPDGDNMLLNLGNPQAWRWAVDQFDQLIRRQGIDLFRQDFNMDPLAYWNVSDPPGARGITQIRHVTGLLAFWDELRRRHPALLIDCCASGGRRNDLETVRRGVPLWRSDGNGDALGEQGHTYGIAFWLPYSGSGIPPTDAYTLRSGMMPSYQVFLQVPGDTAPTASLAQSMLREWKAIAADLLGDYYPLTPYNLDMEQWLAWQFNRPEAGTGVVQAFRRDYSTTATVRFKLRGLDAAATYELKDFAAARTTQVTGRDLLTAGVSVHLAAIPAATTISYRRMDR